MLLFALYTDQKIFKICVYIKLNLTSKKKGYLNLKLYTMQTYLKLKDFFSNKVFRIYAI